jgi:hypothetical protein
METLSIPFYLSDKDLVFGFVIGSKKWIGKAQFRHKQTKK